MVDEIFIFKRLPTNFLKNQPTETMTHPDKHTHSLFTRSASGLGLEFLRQFHYLQSLFSDGNIDISSYNISAGLEQLTYLWEKVCGASEDETRTILADCFENSTLFTCDSGQNVLETYFNDVIAATKYRFVHLF